MKIKLFYLFFEKHEFEPENIYRGLIIKFNTFISSNGIKRTNPNERSRMKYEYELSEELFTEFKLRFL